MTSLEGEKSVIAEHCIGEQRDVSFHIYLKLINNKFYKTLMKLSYLQYERNIFKRFTRFEYNSNYYATVLT